MTKPILTKREVEAERATLKEAEKTRDDLYSKMFIEGQTRRLDFIEQAVELLRELTPISKCSSDYPSYCSEHSQSTPCAVGQSRAFLARYDGTNGKDGE